jgi:hypothetical protein
MQSWAEVRQIPYRVHNFCRAHAENKSRFARSVCPVEAALFCDYHPIQLWVSLSPSPLALGGKEHFCSPRGSLVPFPKHLR